MAQEVVNVGIKQGWSLLAFAKEHGKMQVGEFANKATGEAFKSTIFTADDGSRCFVAFSSKLGVLTPKEISERKHDLQVVELNSGNFKLCAQGENGWQDVEL